MSRLSQDDLRPGIDPTPTPSISISNKIVLWLLLFSICFGLGYPTLNRYDPRSAVGTSDSAEYYKLITMGPTSVEGKMRFRILVPYVARPFSSLAKGRVGTWNPIFLGLLIANALFTATSTYLLISVGYQQIGVYSIALLGSTLYLLNFAIANIWLSGFIDSGEGCLLMAVTWSLVYERWWLLPLIGVVGALAKESFVPLAITYATTWWIVSMRQHSARFSRGAWVATMTVTALATLISAQSIINRHILWPWQFISMIESSSNYLRNLASLPLDRNFWYVFGWLLPLGIWRLRYLSRAWLLATANAVVTGLLLSAYVPPAGTVGRVTFDIAGPILSVSVAILLGDASRLQKKVPL